MARSARFESEAPLAGVRRAFGGWSRQLRRLRRTASDLSVDIGSHHIKVIESEVRTGKLEIVNAICFDTPTASVANYAVRDAAAVADALRRNLDAARIRATTATTCIPGPAAVLKRLKLPIAEAGKLGAMVRSEVENLALFGSDSLCVDYQVSEATDEENFDVLVVAARTETVQSYLDVLGAADIRPEAVDIDYLALANMVDANHGVDSSRTIALVHVGVEFCALGIQSHGAWVFTGNVGIGIGTSNAASASSPDDRSSDSATGPQMRMAEIAREVDRALRFYWPESAGDRVDEILLSGGGAQIPELAVLLAEGTGCSVKPACPFRRALLKSGANDHQGAPGAALFSVAAGLAIRSLERP